MAHSPNKQQLDYFSTFESAVSRYQNADNVQLFRPSSRSLKQWKGVSNNTFNPQIQAYYHYLIIYLSIYLSIAIRPSAIFTLRLLYA